MKFKIISFLKSIDIITKISLILMTISFLFTGLSLKSIYAVDFRVIIILFCLMLTIQNLKEAKIFEWISQVILSQVNNTKNLSYLLILGCFFSSMFITNDVALITFVPFTLLLLNQVKDKIVTINIIILQTIAANLGSQFTPIGNPQNLFIYSYFNLNLLDFCSHMAPITILSLFIVIFLTIFIKKIPIQYTKNKIQIDKKNTIVWSLCFVLCLASVIRVFSCYYLFLILIFFALFLNRQSLKKIDYGLLMTFIALFIFVDNLLSLNFIISHIKPIISKYSYLSAIIFSQIISNVPAAILLAPLNNSYQTLLYALNIGGLGTLIASMASIISYKIFIKTNQKFKKEFLIRFSIYNFCLLFILSTLGIIMLKFL